MLSFCSQNSVLPKGMKRFFPAGTSGLSSAMVIKSVVTLLDRDQAKSTWLVVVILRGRLTAYELDEMVGQTKAINTPLHGLFLLC